jgi:FlaA1/EpsC-like NDP-sugar epimerase
MKNNTSSFICSLIFLAVVGFVDDDTSLKGATIQSVKVFPTELVESLIYQKEVIH